MEKELPIGWVETELHVVAEILDNLRKPINSTERGGRIGNIPYYGATGQAGWIDDYLFDEELVLVGEDGAPFFDKTKNVAYLINGKSWVNNHAHVLKAISKISSNKFLLHFLNQFDYKDFVGGTTRLKLTQGDLKIIPVPLPPLPEQQRIVAKLDTLFGHLDALKTRLDRIPQLLKDFRQKVLTQAVTGKLTVGWREGRELNPIEFETIKKILLKSNPSRANQEKIESIFDEIEIGLFSIPEEWIFANLNKVCSSFSYGTSEKSDNDGLIPVLRMGNLQNGKLDWTDLKYSSNKEEIEKYNLKAGDLLFNRTNSPELVGKTSIYRGEMPAIYAGYLIKIEVIENFLDPEYLNISLNTEFAKNWCWAVKSDGVSQSNINAQKLARFVISLPSLEEQQEIVRRVESLFAKADQIEASYQKLKAKIEQLPQALLAKAFRGELVEQLPTDGDARDLLEQIKLAKEGLEKDGKGKMKKT